MRYYAYFCDMCEEEGMVRLAIARYRDEDGEMHDACEEHLELVEQLGLEHEELSALGGIEG